jgi:hypothetical protein
MKSRIDEHGSYFFSVVNPLVPTTETIGWLAAMFRAHRRQGSIRRWHQFLSQGHYLVLGRVDRDAHGPICYFDQIYEDDADL